MSAQDQSGSNQQMVYVVDDDLSARESLCWLLNTEGIATRAFASAEACLEHWSSDWSGCITVDVRMPGKSGLQLQEELNSRHNLLPVIVLTGHADVPIAIRAMKLGACDFLEKPYSDSELLACVKTALELGREINHAELERIARKALEKGREEVVLEEKTHWEQDLGVSNDEPSHGKTGLNIKPGQEITEEDLAVFFARQKSKRRAPLSKLTQVLIFLISAFLTGLVIWFMM